MVDVINTGSSHTDEVNNITMSNKEDWQKEDSCGTLMKNTKVLNYNKVHASGNADEEVATSSNVTYNMLNGKVRKVCDTV